MTKGQRADGGASRDERGATAVEYAFMASLVAVAVIAAVLWLGEATAAQLCSPSDALRAAGQATQGCS